MASMLALRQLFPSVCKECCQLTIVRGIATSPRRLDDGNRGRRRSTEDFMETLRGEKDKLPTLDDLQRFRPRTIPPHISPKYAPAYHSAFKNIHKSFSMAQMEAFVSSLYNKPPPSKPQIKRKMVEEVMKGLWQMNPPTGDSVEAEKAKIEITEEIPIPIDDLPLLLRKWRTDPTAILDTIRKHDIDVRLGREPLAIIATAAKDGISEFRNAIEGSIKSLSIRTIGIMDFPLPPDKKSLEAATSITNTVGRLIDGQVQLRGISDNELQRTELVMRGLLFQDGILTSELCTLSTPSPSKSGTDPSYAFYPLGLADSERGLSNPTYFRFSRLNEWLFTSASIPPLSKSEGLMKLPTTSLRRSSKARITASFGHASFTLSQLQQILDQFSLEQTFSASQFQDRFKSNTAFRPIMRKQVPGSAVLAGIYEPTSTYRQILYLALPDGEGRQPLHTIRFKRNCVDPDSGLLPETSVEFEICESVLALLPERQLDVRFTFSTSEDITLTENLSLSDIATNGAPRIEFEGRTYWLYSDAEVRRSIEKLEDSETTSIKHVDQSHDGNREFFVECQTSNPEDAWPGLLNLCDRYIR